MAKAIEAGSVVTVTREDGESMRFVVEDLREVDDTLILRLAPADLQAVSIPTLDEDERLRAIRRIEQLALVRPEASGRRLRRMASSERLPPGWHQV
jgi:hypothetical protein